MEAEIRELLGFDPLEAGLLRQTRFVRFALFVGGKTGQCRRIRRINFS